MLSIGKIYMPLITCPDVSHLDKIENVMKRNHTYHVLGSAIQLEYIGLMVEVYKPIAFFHQWTFRNCLTTQVSVNGPRMSVICITFVKTLPEMSYHSIQCRYLRRSTPCQDTRAMLQEQLRF